MPASYKRNASDCILQFCSNCVTINVIMMLLKACVVLSCVLIASAHELLHVPRTLIDEATKLCPEEAHPGCQAKCALEKSHVLTSSGDAINPAMFGPLYTHQAKECCDFTAAPTCEQAEHCVTCFNKKTDNVESDLQKKCEDKFPVVEDIATAILKSEDFERVENLPCLAACLMEHLFHDDDTIDLDSFNPQINSDFHLKKVVSKCEADNQQDGKCLKRASVFACIAQEHELATNQTAKSSD